jgi:hypothetical protein
MKQIIIKIAVCIFLISSLNVQAEEHREGGREHHEAGRERHVFVEHNFRHFNREERQLWRGGHWNNTCFGGRCGWWWFAEGQWFFYANRPGPYPVLVSDVVYVEPVAPVVVEPQAPVMIAPPAPAPTAPPQQSSPTWYYCTSSKSYYPYVASCPEGWKGVPAQPAPPVPQ